MRAAIYVRMSTDDQTDSPERQRSQVLPHCNRNGYRVVNQNKYDDFGERGWHDDRPGFQMLLKDALAGEFDIIVVDEMSRLSRQTPMEFIVKVAYPLQQAGVVVESVAEGRQNWDELVGMILMAVRQDKASQESVTLGRRTATGMLKKAKEGKFFPGRAAYGYRYKKADGERVGLEPDADAPEKGETVRRIFDAYANRDLSLLAIVAELNELGIPSPEGCAQWGKTTVHNILTNHVYVGAYVWGKVPQGKFFRTDGGEVRRVDKRTNRSARRPPQDWLVIPEQHDPLVPAALFDRVQQKLAENRSRTSPSRKKAIYSFSQLLRCSHCRSTMYGTKRKSGGVKAPVYRCGSDMVKGVCAPRVITERAIIQRVSQVLQQRLLDPVERARLEAEVRRQSEQQGGHDEQREKDLRARLTKLDSSVAKATKNLPLLDAEFIPEVQAEIRRLKQERTTAQTELDALTRRSPAGSVEHVVSQVEKLVEVLESGAPALVRPVLREAIDHIDLRFDPVKKAKITRYPLSGGVVHLKVCADSSESGPTTDR